MCRSGDGAVGSFPVPGRFSLAAGAAPRGWAVIVMTQHYLAGELSVLLAGLHTVARDEASARALHRLRQEAETRPLAELASVAQSALNLIDAVCWDSVTRGDMAAFHRQAVAAAELYEFGVCAGLFAEQ